MVKAKARKTFRVLVANGVNLDLLGEREPAHYGHLTLKDLERDLKAFARTLEDGNVQLTFRQTNREDEYLDWITSGWDGLILNPGAWTHTSLALADRLKAVGVPFIEVHLSNLSAREPYRHHSYAAPFSAGVVYGMGAAGYVAALLGLVRQLTSRPSR